VSRTPRKTRQRSTRRSARLGERIAEMAIMLGGMGTIAAVGLILGFLIWTVVPLFLDAELLSEAHLEQPASGAGEVLAMGVDEERRLVWGWRSSGELELIDARTQGPLISMQPCGDQVPSAASFSVDREHAVFGFADGSLRVASIGFELDYLGEEPAELRDLAVGETRRMGADVVERTQAGQLRLTHFAVQLDDPIQTGSSAAIVAIDQVFSPTGHFITSLHADGALRISRVRERENLLTGEVVRTLSGADLSGIAPAGLEQAVFLRISGLGTQLYVGWADGRVAHFDVQDMDDPRLLRVLDVVPAPERRLVQLDMLAGRTTLVVADSAGELSTWFSARGANGELELLRAQVLQEAAGEPVTALAAFSRSRLLAAGFGDGMLRLYQTTLGDLLIETQLSEAPEALVIPHKQDSLLARSANGLSSLSMQLYHPEVNLSSLFLPVHYEGYSAGQHSWESSSGTDDYEPKLGLWPLVFGTLKATFYSMLFGAPLALLAALYTSEFLRPNLRSKVKSSVELMASLPSVVLGFLAALVVAPYVQGVLPQVVMSMFTVPFALLLGAHLWQRLPRPLAVMLEGAPRFIAIAACIPLGVLVALGLGPLAENLLFSGDIMAWLDGQVGAAWAGWLVLLLPACAGIVAIVSGLLPSTERRLGRFLLTVVSALGLALLLGIGLEWAGWDPRGSALSTYEQRNALIVGLAMGFAIVPIIYTLAEDSLSEVPTALRMGSLGAGATPWQTSIRIVVPFAMSGLFSALMIGLGRAVGETMIVLMAAGNTAILDVNIFNGFRTLAANIATEMPEAVRGSGHYRTLFLAALVLFSMTFVLGTVAELVRWHFRRKTRAM
jgi:phosphate transport system permease protein